jgi:hypothetical protein
VSARSTTTDRERDFGRCESAFLAKSGDIMIRAD